MKDKTVLAARVILGIIAIFAVMTNPTQKDFESFCYERSRAFSTPLGQFQFKAIERNSYLFFSTYRARITYSGYTENETEEEYIGFFNNFGKL